MDWRGWARQVVDLINFQQYWLHHIMPDKLKVGLVQKMQHIVFAACEEVIQTDHLREPAMKLEKVTSADAGQLTHWGTELLGLHLLLLLCCGTYMVSPVDQKLAQVAANESSTSSNKHSIALSSRLRLNHGAGHIPVASCLRSQVTTHGTVGSRTKEPPTTCLSERGLTATDEAGRDSLELTSLDGVDL
jgi:hypothetical protein